jgi:hypothetical protein
MGLDSYLYKKTYVQNWEHTSPERRYSVVVKQGGLKCNIKPERISYIIEQVGYWRKFNALHGYIVDTFASGEDNCQHISLEEDDLIQILDTLKQAKYILDSDASDEVKSDKLSDVFPTADGFFFGSTFYADYYAECVDITIILLSDLIDECEDDNYSYSFYYQASW